MTTLLSAHQVRAVFPARARVSRARARLGSATLLLLSAGVLFSGGSAGAHGGEDHGAPPTPTPQASPGQRSASASTSALEVVAKWPAQRVGEPLSLRLIVTAWASNAPIEGAEIDAQLEGPTTATVKASATTSPGIYALALTPTAAGKHALTLTVNAGELVDIVALDGLELGPANAPDQGEEHVNEGGSAWLPFLAGILLGLVIGSVLVVVALRRRRRSAGVIATLCMLVFSTAAGAHGGEDHGDDTTAKKPSSTAPAPAATVGVFLAKESQLLLGVRTVVAEHESLTARFEAPGIVTVPPERRVSVVLGQSGRLSAPSKGFPRLGQSVRRGEVLALLEPVLSAAERATFQAEGARASSGLQAAEARLAAAKSKLSRLESSASVVAPTEIEAARVEVKAAESDIEAARGAQAAYAGFSGAPRSSLSSPIDGIVADVTGAPGEVLEAGRAAFLIVDPRELWVEARVYEDLASRLGDADALVTIPSLPGKSFPARALATSAVVDERTRTIKVVLRLDNIDGLRVGQRATVHLGSDDAREALVVPQAALLDIDGKQIVFVHSGPEVFVAHEVAVGRTDGERIEVVSGLEEGDRVVVQGASMLRNAAPALGR